MKIYRYDIPILIAIKNGHLPIVQYLIEKQNVSRDTFGEYHETLLHCACINGHLPIVEYHISKYANIEAKDEWRKTPLHYAYINGYLPIVEYLISKYANRSKR